MSPKSGPDGGRGEGVSQRRRLAGPLLIVAGLVVAAAVAIGASILTPATQRSTASAIGGPFQLIDQNGRMVDQHVLDGKWTAVFFGYTFCPDTCPATLQSLAAAEQRLGPAAQSFQVVFITVDPARDTPAKMKTYLESQGFPAHVLGLTGSSDQIARAAKAYGIYYAKSGSDPDYTMDHSAAIYLMDPKGLFQRPLAHDMSPKLIAEQIKDAERG